MENRQNMTSTTELLGQSVDGKKYYPASYAETNNTPFREGELVGVWIGQTNVPGGPGDVVYGVVSGEVQGKLLTYTVTIGSAGQVQEVSAVPAGSLYHLLDKSSFDFSTLKRQNHVAFW